MDYTGDELRTQVQRIRVTPDQNGMRLDRFVREILPGLPPAAVHRLLRTGQVRVDGGRAKGNARLVTGQEIRLPPVRLSVAEPGGEKTIPAWALDALRGRILRRDDAFLVLDKPAGMPVHGGSGQAWGVVDGMRLLLEEEPERPELCHRLDRDTSGCLLFGLGKGMTRRLTNAFRGDQVEKRYLALVHGSPPDRGRLDQALVKGMTRAGERMVAADADGAPAQTLFRVVERFAGLALVEARPLTGRTHQIRVHFQEFGHPLAGDDKYGSWELNRHLRGLGLKRLFLHARFLAFPHPRDGGRVEVEAPLDPALEQVLQRLRTGEGA